jgi:hypothetical protein
MHPYHRRQRLVGILDSGRIEHVEIGGRVVGVPLLQSCRDAGRNILLQRTGDGVPSAIELEAQHQSHWPWA